MEGAELADGNQLDELDEQNNRSVALKPKECVPTVRQRPAGDERNRQTTQHAMDDKANPS